MKTTLKLEAQNHGEPQCPDVVAYEHNGNWYYSYDDAMREAEYLGKSIPTVEEWMEMLASVEGTAEEKAKTLNIPLAGYRNADSGTFYNDGDVAYLCSSSPLDGTVALCAILDRGEVCADSDWSGRGLGVSLRFLEGGNRVSDYSTYSKISEIIENLKEKKREATFRAERIQEAIDLLANL